MCSGVASPRTTVQGVGAPPTEDGSGRFAHTLFGLDLGGTVLRMTSWSSFTEMVLGLGRFAVFVPDERMDCGASAFARLVVSIMIYLL